MPTRHPFRKYRRIEDEGPTEGDVDMTVQEIADALGAKVVDEDDEDDDEHE